MYKFLSLIILLRLYFQKRLKGYLLENLFFKTIETFNRYFNICSSQS